MARRRYEDSVGRVMAEAEAGRSVAGTVNTAIHTYYNKSDQETAQQIRRAPTEEAAAQMVQGMRRGRASDVLMVAGSAAAGVAAGALSQKVVGNYTIKRVAPIGALGLVPVGVGLWAPVGLAGRAMMAVGGAAYVAGTVVYSLVAPQEAQP